MSTRLEALISDFEALPAWTGTVYKQASSFLGRGTAAGQGEEGSVPAAARHLASQLYIAHETVLFLCAAQDCALAYDCISYPNAGFPPLQAIGAALTGEPASPLRTLPEWRPFQMPAAATQPQLRTLERLIQEAAGVLIKLCFDASLHPFDARKRARRHGAEFSSHNVYMDRCMQALYYKMLRGRLGLLSPAGLTPVSDIDMLLPCESALPRQWQPSGIEALASLFLAHNKIAFEQGRFEGWEPLFTMAGGRSCFILCERAKERTWDVVDHGFNIKCAIYPRKDFLFPVCNSLALLTHRGMRST